MAEHDQRLKTMLRQFLPELIELRLPDWQARYDFSLPLTWLEQEVFVDPPRGERRELDLVVRLPLLQPMGGARVGLVHVEVESGDSVADLRQRMPAYHDFLGYKHGLPVLSLALYLGVALEGLGWDEAREEHWEETLGTTRWPYLGLPGLDARQYVEGNNLLGVALSVLMRVADEDRAWLKARAMQRIATAELTVYRRHLLMECVEAYLPLEGPHLQQFRDLLLTKDFREAQMLAKTSFELGMEKGMEKGEEKGRVEGQRGMVREQLEDKFGPLSASARQRLEAVPPERLRELGRKLLSAASLAELGLDNAPTGPSTNGA